MDATRESPPLALRVRNLTRYFGKRIAVDRLSLDVPAGSSFGLLGPNGAGKTTTILMALGILRPNDGEVQLLGSTIADPHVRARIGYVPERFQLPRFLTAREFLVMHGRLLGMDDAAAHARASECLERVDLTDRGDDRMGGFSRGMQQRMAIAQAILGSPSLLIFDEPTSALDPLGRKDVRDLVNSLRGDATIIFNSHQLHEVEALCDHVAILRNGRLVHQGAVADLARPGLDVTLRVGGDVAAVREALRSSAALDGQQLPEGGDGEPLELSLRVPDDEAAADLAERVITAGGRLYELATASESLEDIFVRVVGEDQQSGAGA